MVSSLLSSLVAIASLLVWHASAPDQCRDVRRSFRTRVVGKCYKPPAPPGSMYAGYSTTFPLVQKMRTSTPERLNACGVERSMDVISEDPSPPASGGDEYVLVSLPSSLRLALGSMVRLLAVSVADTLSTVKATLGGSTLVLSLLAGVAPSNTESVTVLLQPSRLTTAIDLSSLVSTLCYKIAVLTSVVAAGKQALYLTSSHPHPRLAASPPHAPTLPPHACSPLPWGNPPHLDPLL